MAEELIVPEGYEWITQEYADLGLTPTQADIDNWVEYGQPGQITVELGGGMTTLDVGGTELRVYTKLPEAEDFEFNYSNKEGQVFAVPEGTAVAGGNNYKLVGTKDIDGVSYDIYANEGEQGSGLSGLIEDATGIDLNKIVPNEVKSGIVPIPGISDPFGVTQGIVFGAEGAEEGLGVLSDITGLQPEEIQMAQDLGWTAASIAAGAATGNPYVTAGMMSLKQTSDTTKTDEDWNDLSKNVALNFAIAGTLDMAGKLLTNSAALGGGSPDVPVPEGGEGGLTDLYKAPSVPDAETIANVMPEGVMATDADFLAQTYPINNTTAGLDAPVTNPVADSGYAYDEFGSVTPTVKTSAQEEYWKAATANINKPWYKDPSILLPVAGLGLSVYGLMSRPSPDDLLDEQTDAQKELIELKSEKEKELLMMQMEHEAAMQEEALKPVPSTPPPSMYTKKYGVS